MNTWVVGAFRHSEAGVEGWSTFVHKGPRRPGGLVTCSGLRGGRILRPLGAGQAHSPSIAL